MEITNIIGLAAGICVTIAVIPQIIKVWKSKKVKNVSLTMFSTLTLGIFLWVVYGFLKKDYPIMITNSISLFLNIVMIYFISKYEKE
ncbi:SemiSWEET transporter [Flavobacterium sp. LS1R47]|jgi:MtN3 and saliva related transmembrane protein|uniref:SemiSWEET transporter n=1 Tax=Flavobacterium frigoritolerans TaxID=2987686 RepID=A0A9X3C859_9FLAO|nr:SemiSWEET transporter [Flavobacterium frigoritolerans]MCV9933042.1 SemiSWEET transporter [Flavobacterium frigoritolerans]